MPDPRGRPTAVVAVLLLTIGVVLASVASVAAQREIPDGPGAIGEPGPDETQVPSPAPTAAVPRHPIRPGPVGLGASPGPSATPEPRSDDLPTAAFGWRRSARVDEGWDGYDPSTSRYPADYAMAAFPVELNGCRSDGQGRDIEAYEWRVRAPDGTLLPVATYETCRARFIATEEGRHRVRLRVSSSAGEGTRTRNIPVEDELIIVLGDSMASGQGNPPWVDERCDRSVKSGLSLAADRIEERLRRSTVTLVNFACSGAEIDSGLLGPYAGMHPPSVINPEPPPVFIEAPPLEAQLDAATRWLCGGLACGPDARSVDAIFLSIGINDLSFSGIIVVCANPLEAPCQQDDSLRQGIETGLSQIASGLEQLAARLNGPFSEAAVYLMTYPDDPFDSRSGGRGCGVLSAVDADEASWLHRVGRRLNGNLKGYALRNRFYPVEGIARAFRGDGYCASSPMFVGVAESFAQQGARDGTLHPNRRGHAAIADAILAAYDEPKPERRLLGRAIVTLREVAIADETAASDGDALTGIPTTLVMRAVATQEGYWMRGDVRSWIDRVVPNGDAVDLPAEDFRLIIPIWDQEDLHVTATTCLPPEGAGPGAVRAVRLPDTGGRLPIGGTGGIVQDPGSGDPETPTLRCLSVEHDHPAAEGWRTGPHTLTDELSDGSLRLTYTVRFRPIGQLPPGASIDEVPTEVGS